MKTLRFNKGILFLSVLVLLVSLITPIKGYAVAASVKLNKTSVNLGIGETFQLKITGSNSKVKWSTNNKSIVTISSDGLIKGIKPGFTEITAEVNNKKLKCSVVVYKPRLERNSISLGIDDKLDLKISYLPVIYKNTKITWKSDNTKIATVDENGVVTGITAGNTKIKVSFGNYSLNCSVYINPTKKNINDAIDNLSYEYGEIGNQIKCVLTNNSKIDLLFDYKLVFYDENNKIVSVSNKIATNLLSNNSKVLSFEKSNKDYKSYKIVFERTSFYYNESNLNMKNSVDITVEKVLYSYEYYGGNFNDIKDSVELLNLHVNNKSNDRIFLEAYIIYYKDSNIVYIDGFWDESNVDVGSSILLNPKIIFNDFSKITIPEYDEYKVIYNANSYN
ncbi:Ig-like domain-containing protein [Lachnoclostridium phytofermentans]|uniref:Ig domain protein group 2 domain protein n=1 Tax=Lachnoclostridium phytofermentans (strain ATCC 700394 / DSM 18823 / ISDg) TaxID=357809 RepID=A9KMU6_LACP7|nr:Ig-like domain-containing protein [Lachnoclostridium phytofermentans]ABX42957.1 Ig domain protein group 2 domain protein [Lachnoclostridium phytofermentans ISDg]